MTMHGTIMVFFVLTTAPFAGFGNFVLPIQVGAEDMAFPRFNMMSFWVTFARLRGARRGILRPRRTAALGVDRLRPAERGRQGRRARARALGQTLWVVSIAHLLRRPAARLTQLHRDHARPARPRA